MPLKPPQPGANYYRRELHRRDCYQVAALADVIEQLEAARRCLQRALAHVEFGRRNA